MRGAASAATWYQGRVWWTDWGTYDISNKHRLGYSEVELVQKMIDGVNTLYLEDEAFKKAHGI